MRSASFWDAVSLTGGSASPYTAEVSRALVAYRPSVGVGPRRCHDYPIAVGRGGRSRKRLGQRRRGIRPHLGEHGQLLAPA